MRSLLLGITLFGSPAFADPLDAVEVDELADGAAVNAGRGTHVPQLVIEPRRAPGSLYSGPPLVVGVKSTPPFAFKGQDDRWRGVSVELWTVLAEDAGIPWELREMKDLGSLLGAVESGEIDVAVGALTVTAEREARFDFSHAFHHTGYGIAVQREDDALSWLANVFSPTLWSILLGLVGLLLTVGALVWLAERKHNPEQFGGSVVHGLAAGLWWSAVTMTTVGYGDKSPQTIAGRAVALVWMFSSIIVISVTTAAITTSLTVSRLEVGIAGVHDLPGHTVGSVEHSTSVDWLRENHLSVRPYSNVDEALTALAEGELDAVVYDASILRYLVRTRGDGRVRVVTGSFGRQSYALGLAEGAPHRELINRALLTRLDGRWWDDLVFRYTGESR